MNNDSQALERFHKKVWITRGCRFEASNRLGLHAKWSTITMTIISVYTVALNLTVYLPNTPWWLSPEIVNYITICASILVLGISLILGSREYPVKAQRFHDCGKELSFLYEELNFHIDFGTKLSQEELREFAIKYNQLIQRFDLNHDAIDFLVFKANNSKAFSHSNWFKFKVTIQHFSITLLPYWIWIVLPPIVVFALIFLGDK